MAVVDYLFDWQYIANRASIINTQNVYDNDKKTVCYRDHRFCKYFS